MTAADAPPPGQRATRPRQRARTRAKIEQAARALFADGGYLTCSVADIVAAAGVSRAVFYLHFRDKRDLLAAVIRGGIAVQGRFLLAIALRPKLADADLHLWIYRYMRGIERALEGVRLMNLGTFVDRELAAESFRQQTDRILEIVHRNPAFKVLDEAGEVRPDRLVELSLLVMELGQVALALSYQGWLTDRAAAVDMFVARFRRFIDAG